MAEKILVASGKGGVGKSTFTAGISKELSLRGKKVLAIDCDIGLRSLDLLLGCSADVVFDWGDVILGRCTVNQAILTGDVDFIAAPGSTNEEFTGEAFMEMVESVSAGYDYIFIDSPAGISHGMQLAACGAEKAVVITTPDNICVRSCSRAFSELEKLGKKDIRLVINMFESKQVIKGKLLNVDECIDETGVQLLGVIPMDRSLGFTSVTGDDPGEYSPSSLAFERIAGRLEGEKIKLVCQ